MRLNEIEERLAAIKVEADTDGADINALTEETTALIEERKNILANAEKRDALIKSIVEDNEQKGEMITMNETEKRVYNADSTEYRSAWLKTMMGKELNTEERDAMTSATASAGYVIPTVTANKVIEKMVQIAPMLKEVDLMQIPGNVTLAIEDTVNAAAIHTEGTAVTPAADTIARVNLGGYELVKLVSISAKLEAMAIDAFEDWITSNLSRKLAELMENYIVNGTGTSQPKGIDAAETWTDGTNAVDWAGTAPTTAEIQKQIGLLNGAYVQNAKFLMNWKTFWNRVHALRDDKNPAVVNDGQGGYRLFGFPVIFSAKVEDDDIFFGDFHEAVKANLAAPVKIEANAASGFRYNAVDYRGTCLFDCATVAGCVIKAAATL